MDKLETLLVAVLILFQAIWNRAGRHPRFFKAVAALGLALICIPRAMHGGQNAVLVGWIGLASLLTFVGIGARALSNSIRFHELEPVDHKVQPDRSDWFAQCEGA